MTLKHLLNRAAVGVALLLLQEARGELIWTEGEAAKAHTTQVHGWYGGAIKKDLLSGGAWLSHFSDTGPAEATYEITAKSSGSFTLWVRANPVQAGMSWKTTGDWQPIDLERDKRGEQNLANDNKPDLRFITWVKAGQVDLKAGSNTLVFRFDGKTSHHGALDCFVLTDRAFVPQGFTKPEENPVEAGPSDWFQVAVDDDPFVKNSVIDMSSLIEAPAGKQGRVIAKGKDLVFESDPTKPIKLWGLGSNLEAGKYTREQLGQRAKYLRKFGVNLVRQHPLFDDVSTAGEVDPKKLDDYDWWFAELKKNGIYTQWSIFYHFPIHERDGYDKALFAELPDLGNGLRDSYGLITVSPELWEIRTKVLVEFLNHKNPYTGMRYADDPALSCVEMQNEDSIFFWNPLGSLAGDGAKAPLHSRLLRRQFARWAEEAYGSETKLKDAWGNLRPGDKFGEELEEAGPFEFGLDGPGGKWAGQDKRAGDYTRFLTEMQMAFYTACEKAIRATGYKSNTVTTNWLAGSAAQDPANIYTDTVGSMIDRHNYAGGGGGGHGVHEGGIYADSHLGKPGAHLFMIGLKQVEDRPFSVSEWTMGPPNQWKLEAAPLMAFYGMGLQGWDASMHFIQTGTRLGDGWPGLSTYASDTPHYIGQFPALSFALLNGHFKEGPLVAARRMKTDDLFQAKAPLKQDFYDGTTLHRIEGGTPLEVFAMGRVTMGFGGGKSEAADFSKLWNKEALVIESATGEMTWDYGRELVTVHPPKTQAILGKAGGRTIVLPGVTATVKTPFVSLIFTPLDNADLAESKRVLITAMARDKQSGARYSADGTKLEAVGTAPLLMEPVEATLKFKGAKPSSVTACDPYGAPIPGRKLEIQDDGSFAIDGRQQAYYYEVLR